MRLLFLFSVFFALVLVIQGCAGVPPRLAYPAARTTDQVDDDHGVAVHDPYRWLEDENSAETKAWVEAENKVTFGWLAGVPEREAIRRRLTQLWNFERYGTPVKEGSRYFFSKNNGLQNQSVLYTMASLEAEPALLLDPNSLSARWHGGAFWHGHQSRWQPACLWHLGLRLGLAGMEGARCAYDP